MGKVSKSTVIILLIIALIMILLNCILLYYGYSNTWNWLIFIVALILFIVAFSLCANCKWKKKKCHHEKVDGVVLVDNKPVLIPRE